MGLPASLKPLPLFLVLGPAATSALGQYGQLFFNQDFRAYGGAWENYTQARVQADFGATEGPYKGLDGRTKVGNGMLRAFFAKGALLGEETGFSWFQKLPAGVKEATLEYRIKFEAREPGQGFDWTLGGKLPGFAGGVAPRGCYTRASYDKTQEGFTMRIMWQRQAGMITYPYYPESPQVPEGRTSICGGAWSWSQGVASSAWYTLRQHVILNTPGRKNGIIRCYLNGRLVQEKTDVMFRTSGEVTSIDKAYWTTYVGGSTDAFRPDRDQYIYFDDFKVWIGGNTGVSLAEQGRGAGLSPRASAAPGFPWTWATAPRGAGSTLSVRDLRGRTLWSTRPAGSEAEAGPGAGINP